MIKKIIYTLLLFIAVTVNAQVKVGNNPTTINSNAVVEMEASNKGMLLPRVTLTATDNPAPLTAHVPGMMVYNTATGGTGKTAVVPGIYLNDGTKWALMYSSANKDTSSNGSAQVDSWDCSGALTGTLKAGTAVSGVTKVVTANVIATGSYDISATADGVTFSASGIFSATGSQTVTLTASGTPDKSGIYSYSLNTAPNCSFDINITGNSSNGTATVNSWDCGGALNGILVVGVPASGVTKVITADVAEEGTYSISAVANGVTFTASGTFAGTGLQPVTLTASGTPAGIGSFTYTPNTTPTCSFNVYAYQVSSPSYRITGRTGSNQTLTPIGTDIIFNNAGTGNIPYNTATGEFSLTAGKTYRLTFAGTLANATNFVFVSWMTGSTGIGKGMTFLPASYGGADAGNSVLECLYTPATNLTVKVQVTNSGGGSPQLQAGENVAIVQEVGVQNTGNSLPMADRIFAGRTTSTQTITSGTDLIINQLILGNIPLNTTTGVFSLEAGKSYRLSFSAELRAFNAGSSWVGVEWVDATTNTPLVANASGGIVYPKTTATADAGVMSINTIYTPTVNQTVKLRCTSSSGSAVMQTFSNAVCIQQLGVDNALNLVKYALANRTTNSAALTTGSDVIMTNLAAGTIPYNTTTGVFTLTAGKTYRLTFKGEMNSFSNTTAGYESVAWVDAATNTALTPYGQARFVPSTATGTTFSGNPLADIIYSPTTNQTVKLRITAGTGTAVLKAANQEVTVQELGYSAK
jgi:hypothetical protein